MNVHAAQSAVKCAQHPHAGKNIQHVCSIFYTQGCLDIYFCFDGLDRP